MNDFNTTLTGFNDTEITNLSFEQNLDFDMDFDLSDDDMADDSHESAPKYVTCPYCNEEFTI